MAETYTSGVTGRVKAGSTTVVFLGKWDLDKNVKIIASPTFESTADANGVVWTPKTLLGLAEGNIDAEGWFDVGDNSETTFYVGWSGTVDLQFTKTSAFGYNNVPVRVESIRAGTAVESNQPAYFRVRFAITGIAPTAGSVT